MTQMLDKAPSGEELRKLFDTQQYHDIWFGACRLALALQELIRDIQCDRKLNNTKFVNNVLSFLTEDKSDMLTYIINSGSMTFRIAPVRSKNRKIKEWKPYKLLHDDGKTPEFAETEYISNNEHKWRETARIFLDALNEACTTISMLTGREQNDVFNQLLKGRSIAEPEHNAEGKEPLITESAVADVKISKSDIPHGIVTPPSICMDFFSGSATTAHATMQLNAEDGGKRRFIMVQSPEPCDKNSEAYKAGYATIAEIGKERIRRAAKKIAKENPGKEFDGGFQVWKTESAPPLSGSDKHPKPPTAGIHSRNSIAEFILKCCGLPTDTQLEELEVLDGRFWSANGGRLIFSDEPGVTIEQAKAICEMKPDRIVLTKASTEVTAEVVKYLKKHERIKLRGD